MKTSYHLSENFNETAVLPLDFFSRYDTTTGLLKIQRSVAFEKVTGTFLKIDNPQTTRSPSFA